MATMIEDEDTWYLANTIACVVEKGLAYSRRVNRHAVNVDGGLFDEVLHLHTLGFMTTIEQYDSTNRCTVSVVASGGGCVIRHDSRIHEFTLNVIVSSP